MLSLNDLKSNETHAGEQEVLPDAGQEGQQVEGRQVGVGAHSVAGRAKLRARSRVSTLIAHQHVRVDAHRTA